MNKISLKQTIQSIKLSLSKVYQQKEAEALARVVVEKVTCLPWHQALAHANQQITEPQLKQIEKFVSLLKLQKPIQYILGETEFFGINLIVTPDVLIPRPETEELVDWIIKNNTIENPLILDIGTGSGCIAIALAKNIPKAMAYAMDISTKAIEIAKENAERTGVDVIFIEHDILSEPQKIAGSPFDIIVSNPPYVGEREKALMQPNVLENEPHQALFVDNKNPLIFYKAIASFSNINLKQSRMVFCEINEALGQETADVFRNNGFKDVEIKEDINGKERMLRARFGGN